MLHPHAHGERLGLHGNALGEKGFKGIPGAVADGQNHAVTGEQVGIRLMGDLQAGDAALGEGEGGDLMAEAHFSAQLEDSLPQHLHHGEQYVGTHMGLGIIENFRVGACGGKLREHPLPPGILRAGVELPVGEGTGAALAKLHVALWIQLAGFEEFFHHLVPRLGVVAALKYNRTEPGFGQHQRGKHAAGAKAHHHRTMGGRYFRLWNVIGIRIRQGDFLIF